MEFGQDPVTRSPAMQWRDNAARRFQYYLDKSTPHPVARWLGSLLVAILYCFRIYYVKGFYIVAYGLGIYLLNLLIGFLSPQADLQTEGPALPTKGSDEFKPFIRRLPEFKFWYALTKAICIAFVLTFFSIFDVPVFWPILLLYWIVLFVLTMKRQIRHMIKYKYVPFSVGKQAILSFGMGFYFQLWFWRKRSKIHCLELFCTTGTALSNILLFMCMWLCTKTKSMQTFDTFKRRFDAHCSMC